MEGHPRLRRIAVQAWQGAVAGALRASPIEGAHPCPYLDATVLDACWAGKAGNVESEASWSELPTRLPDRGRSGGRLVIVDEHAGLAALRACAPASYRAGPVVSISWLDTGNDGPQGPSA